MSTGENIRALRDLHGITQEQLATKLGVTRESVVKWESGKINIRDRHVSKIVELFGVDPDDIKSDAYGLAAKEHGIVPKLPPNAIIPSQPRKAYAPLLGRVHAGDAQEPDIIEDNVSLPYEVWDAHRDGYFLQVEGGCMSKVYPEGCYIFVDPRKQPQNGSIAVVSIDGDDYVMRRLYRGANTMILSPDSWDDGYEDIVISGHDERTVEFVGVVVWFQASKEME